jgi:DNA gyrase subunit A
MSRFALSELQAQAILDMRLQRLTNLERDKILEEHAEVTKQIARYKEILADEREVAKIVVEELEEVKKQYGDERRTEIVEDPTEISIEDLIAEEDMVVTISHEGYIKRSPVALYRAQRRGGRGRIGMRTKDEDFVSNIFIASTHSYILIFTDRGRVYWLKVHEVPEVGPQGKGKAVVNLVKLQSGEKIAAFCSAKAFDAGGYVLLATRNGIVKKTELSNFSNPRTGGIIALGVEDDDALIDAVLTSGQDQILLASRDGMAIRFSEEDVRPMGRTAYGVKGIELDEGDAVVALNVVFGAGTVLTVCENGYGKRTDIEEYRVQNRGGKGLINIKTSGRNGKVVGVNFLLADEGVMLITEKGMIIRLNTADISTIGRNTQGVRLIQLEDGDHLVSVARLAEKEEGEEPGSPDPS